MIKRMIKKSLSYVGLVVEHKSKSGGYISAEEITSKAREAGLSVCEYVEKTWNSVGETQKVIDRIFKNGLGEFKKPTVLEIGAGTGRYLDKIINSIEVNRYESYETAEDWAKWLETTNPIISHKADGKTLKQTESQSVDFTHAHGVFVYLPTIVTLLYLNEIIRVSKSKSLIFFDIISEDCLDEENRIKWIGSTHYYPIMFSKKIAIEIFEKAGFRLIDNYIHPYGQGVSEYLVFNRP